MDATVNGGGHLNGYESGYNGESNGPSRDQEIKPEPEKIRVWREEQQRMLEQKDAEEAQRKEELRVHAKKELEEWYTRYADQLEKTKLSNRYGHCPSCRCPPSRVTLTLSRSLANQCNVSVLAR